MDGMQFLSNPLTTEQAQAAARSYGWNVTPHQDGGFFAAQGQYGLTVVFRDGIFLTANIRRGLDDMAQSLTEQEVIGHLAQHGSASQ